ncbi:MAG: DNA polymerase III subunit gamma/tau [Candidatus Shapirobacteria bacterium]|nr:DNA polymerase III subunit gamma/tau [Candidatus Shapirobacteria bacterium]MDD4382739.1 DNA polymerase III subunit gamma/tau [Candidatus Shapirobacteria bacterium]
MSVFHLKYRPVKFSDLDLADVAESLKKYLSAKDVPQSFLFSGPKGAGKTSAARILARAVNCTDLKNGEPCEECDNCKEIIKGGAMDVIEMDAASNRGIEDIRSLKDKAYLLPSKLNKKVFIIDEVHMLTKDAFNALLKLIEEPPKHTIFVLCTTDAEKIPDTVLSRLVRVDFRKGGRNELISSLKKIIEGEGIEIAKEAIDFIVEKSDGSFRNLQRNFNELYLQLGKKLKTEDVFKFYLDKSGNYNEEDFDKDLNNGEIKLILEKLEKMADDGVDFSSFRLKLMNFFQKKILAFYGISTNSAKKNGLNLEESEFFMNLLIKASKIEKDVEIDQLPMELAVVEFGETKRSGVKKNEEIEESAEQIVNETKIEEKIIITKVETHHDASLQDSQNICSLEIETIEGKWGNLLTAVKPFNYAVEAFLRATRPKSVKGNILLLEVFYPFHKDRLEESKNRKIVEEGISKVFGVNLGFECVLAKNKKQPLVIKNDTPMEHVSDQLSENKDDKAGGGDIYDVAKEIFG